MRRGSVLCGIVCALFLVALAVPASSATAAQVDGAKEVRSVNVNTADAGALASLPGIGRSKAEAIVVYREANGPFETVDELSLVKGIGVKVLDRIRDLVRTH